MRLHVLNKSLVLFVLSLLSIVSALFYLNYGLFQNYQSKSSDTRLLQELSQSLNSTVSPQRSLRFRILPQGPPKGNEDFNNGYGDGYVDGYKDGYADGEDDDDDYGNKYDDEEYGDGSYNYGDGYDEGYDDGYDKGYDDGSKGDKYDDSYEDKESSDDNSGEGSSDNSDEESPSNAEEVAPEKPQESIESEETQELPPVTENEEVVVIIEDPNTEETSQQEDGCSGNTPYTLQNGTCIDKCPVTEGYFVQIDTTETKLFCTSCDQSCTTCSNATRCTTCKPDSPYLYANFTCLANCSEDNYSVKELANGVKTCFIKDSLSAGVTPQKPQKSALSLEQQKTARVTSNYTTVGGTLVSIGMVCSQMKNQGAAGNLALMLLLNQIEYIKYFDIKYSPLLMEIFNNQVTNIVSFDISPDFPFKGSAQDDVTPSRISRYNICGLFLANLWGELITIIILVGATLMIIGLQRINHGFPLFNKILSWLQNFFVWNFLLAFLLSNVSDIFFYGIIEYQSHYPKDSLSISSLILSILFFLATVALLSFALYKLYQLHNKQSYASFEEKVKANNKTRLLFEEVKDQHWAQRYFVPITSFRAVLCATITAAINLPQLQTSLLATINILMIAYLIKFQPMRTRFGNIELAIYEVLVFIANIACFRLSLLDPTDQQTSHTSSDVVVVINIIYISFLILVQAFSRGKDLFEFYKEFTKQRNSHKKVLPTLPIQEEQSPRQSAEVDRQAQEDKSPGIIENGDDVKQPLTFRERGFSSPNSDSNAIVNMSSTVNETEGGENRQMSLGFKGGCTPNSDTNVPDSMSAINDTKIMERNSESREGLSLGFRGLSISESEGDQQEKKAIPTSKEEKVRELRNKRSLKFRRTLTLMSESSEPGNMSTINGENTVQIEREEGMTMITLVD